jgi:hypothetical protein
MARKLHSPIYAYPFFSDELCSLATNKTGIKVKKGKAIPVTGLVGS